MSSICLEMTKYDRVYVTFDPKIEKIGKTEGCMKFSRYMHNGTKQEAFAWQKPLGLDHSFSNRYSRTRFCISSSRSILQIMLRALL